MNDTTSTAIPSSANTLEQSLNLRLLLERARHNADGACKLIEGIQYGQAARLIDVLMQDDDAESLDDEVRQAGALDDLAGRLLYEAKFQAYQLDGYLEKAAQKGRPVDSEDAGPVSA